MNIKTKSAIKNPQACSQKNHSFKKHGVKGSVSIMLLLAVVTIFLEIFTPGIVEIFSKTPELLEVTVPAMRILLSTMIFIGPTIMFITVFQGLSRGMMALILSLARQFLLFVPLLYLMSYLFGLYGVWWALPVSDVLSFVLTFIFTYLEYKKHKQTHDWSGFASVSVD